MAESTIQDHPLTGWHKPELDLSNAEWHSSSRGLGDVQIAFVEGFIAMRNSDRPESPSLIFTPHGVGRVRVRCAGGRIRPHLSRGGRDRALSVPPVFPDTRP